MKRKMYKVVNAARKGDNVLKELLQNGMDVNAVDKKKGQHFIGKLRMDMLTM